ncbi:putative epoxide hydrolase [Lineolata rhizophorae]|uniref:Putative epoxide hydrolase n=1 Tax=Lineolata rhizophorae TaxID=578093 RepID=A0A6A6PF81_9PEZI|nr:putative epoxide hydrolase [Lineolata rhizophorae]
MVSSQFLRAIESSNQPFGRVPEAAKVKQHSCELDVPPSTLTELRSLVNAAELGPETCENVWPGAASKYGLTHSWMKEAVQNWGDETLFNWSEIQNSINSVPHFTTTVEHCNRSYTVHYTALFSERSDAIPIVNIHGWPGCFLEFLGIMNKLQSEHTPSTLPYHFIVLSMPGYTFSSGPPLEREDFNVYDVSRIFQSVLAQLGFSDSPDKKYIVAGGDIGSRVARGLAVLDPACAGVHLNFCADLPMLSYSRENLSDHDRRRLQRLDEFMREGIGYGMMHATRPATLGFVLSSSPVALLAWLAEKYISWADEDTTPSTETILTFVTLYWLTQTLPRSIYPYRSDFAPSERVPSHGHPAWNIPAGKAFGYSDFPNEIQPVPKEWVEKTGRLSWYNVHDKGGHFAALERPEAVLLDLKNFVDHALDKDRQRA